MHGVNEHGVAEHDIINLEGCCIKLCEGGKINGFQTQHTCFIKACITDQKVYFQ